MHGAGVERGLRLGLGFGLHSAGSVQIALRISGELLATARAAEILRAGAMPLRVPGALDLHRHAAYGVDRGAGWASAAMGLVMLMLHRPDAYPGGLLS